MPHRELALRDVYLARQRIMSLAQRTPILDAPRLSEKGKKKVVLKLENLQTTGSFKIRGATKKSGSWDRTSPLFSVAAMWIFRFSWRLPRITTFESG